MKGEAEIAEVPGLCPSIADLSADKGWELILAAASSPGQ